MKGQLEFAKLTGGAVVPGSGAAGGDFSNDVHMPNGWHAEVKRFQEGEKTLYGWLGDTRERPDVVAFRADRMPWVVAMWGPKYKALMAVQMAALEVLRFTEDQMPNPAFFEEYTAAVGALTRAIAQSTRKAVQEAPQEGGDEDE